ncbi:MAG: hypothetical protein EBZ77_00415, partial [Chitinophagia bacterium]|nr:hypothetical protein [Chitinophagia bacterium]
MALIFLASIIVSLIGGNLILRYSTPIYQTKAELLINDSKKGGSSSTEDVLTALKINTNRINIENEIEILGSRTLMEDVVSELNLRVSYSVPARFKTANLYKLKPFVFTLADSTDNSYNCKVTTIDASRYELTLNNKVFKGHWGDTLTLPQGKVVLTKTALFNSFKDPIAINVASLSSAAKRYMHIEMQTTSKGASALNLTTTDDIPERSVDILNSLMKQYRDNNISTRTKIAERTILFINQRLETVGRELSNVENSIETFKQEYNIADMNAQSSALVGASAETMDNLRNAEVELDMIRSVSDLLQHSDNDKTIILPASLLMNPGLAQLMTDFNNLQVAIEKSLIANTKDNPVTRSLINQKRDVKQSIIAALASTRNENELKVRKIKEALGDIDKKVNQVPSVERKYLDYARMQNTKQDLYVFLLKKREETDIERSSTVADALVIDPAESDSMPLRPNKSRIISIALLVGAVLPFGFILLRRALNVKVISKSDISKISRIPIIG